MNIARIKANKEQLESIGISYKISNLKGKIKKYYKSGYIQIEINHTLGGIIFTKIGLKLNS